MPSFAFNASALAFGGRIQQPSSSVIPSQASVVLAPSGGEGYETIRNFDYKGIITFDEASVYVAGSEHGDIRNTLASVTIKNLNVLNLFHAEFLTSRVSSRHVLGEDEGEITFHGTSIENLRIGGRPAKVNFNHAFYARYPTHASLTDVMARVGREVTNDPDVQKLVKNEDERIASIANSQSMQEERGKKASRRRGKKPQEVRVLEIREKNVAELMSDRFCWKPEECEKGAPVDHGAIHCSLVDSIENIDVFDDTQVEDKKDPKYLKELRSMHPVHRNGYVVKVAEFGSIKLGELIIKPGERRLNLLRFQFGCPFVGDGSGLCVSTNGTDIMP